MQLQSELQWRGEGGKPDEKRAGATKLQVGGLRVLRREEEGGEEGEMLVDSGEASNGHAGSTEMDELEHAVVAAEALSASDALIARRTRVRLEVRFPSLSFPLSSLPVLTPDHRRTTTVDASLHQATLRSSFLSGSSTASHLTTNARNFRLSEPNPLSPTPSAFSRTESGKTLSTTETSRTKNSRRSGSFSRSPFFFPSILTLFLPQLRLHLQTLPPHRVLPGHLPRPPRMGRLPPPSPRLNNPLSPFPPPHDPRR
jgi:hypothetical protein